MNSFLRRCCFWGLLLMLFCPAMSLGATTFTLEAQETEGGSCPWIFSWSGSEYVQDNDIYSVARFKTGEYQDFYLMQKPLVSQGSRYTLEIRELANEDSWTDSVGLIAVDHAADVKVGVNEKGNIFSYKPSELITPVTAVSNAGADLNQKVRTVDGNSFDAYSGDYLDVDFGSVDTRNGARVVLRIKGFNTGGGEDRPFIGPPAIVVQVLSGEAWQEIGRLNPRFDWSEGVFSIPSYLLDTNSRVKIRLYSISHGTKYTQIDFAGLSVGEQPPVTINRLALAYATFKGADVSGTLLSPDANYVAMTTGEKFAVSFEYVPQLREERSFIFVSQGYYIPKTNTFYVYTWDGSSWVERGRHSFPATDSSHTFDLSAFLPDPTGQYKVRVYQSYTWDDAAIDFAGMNVDETQLALYSATDLRNGNDIRAAVANSDDTRFTYTSGGNRWSEYRFGVFTVTPNAGLNGKLSPAAPQLVNYNQTTSFTVTPDKYALLESVTGCNGTLNNNIYTTGAITADCTVTAGFYPTRPTAPPSFFTVSPRSIALLGGYVTASWGASPTQGAVYELERSSNGGAFVLVDRSFLKTWKFLAKSLGRGSHVFRVRAVAPKYAPSNWHTATVFVQ